MLRNATKLSRLRTKIFLLWVCYDIVYFLCLDISELGYGVLCWSVIAVLHVLPCSRNLKSSKSSETFFQKRWCR